MKWEISIFSMVMDTNAISTMQAYDAQGNLRQEKQIEIDRGDMNKYKSELSVILAALKEIKPSCNLTLKPLSLAIQNAIRNGWAEEWRKNGWKTTEDKPPREKELWEEVLKELDRHEVKVE